MYVVLNIERGLEADSRLYWRPLIHRDRTTDDAIWDYKNGKTNILF